MFYLRPPKTELERKLNFYSPILVAERFSANK